MKSRPLGRKGVVVGDRVRLVGDVSGADGLAGPDRRGRGAHAPCCGAPRTTTTRSSGSIVANADQLVVVTALADPEPRPRPDRPLPRGGVRRGHGPAALPDQGRPGRPRRAAVDATGPWACRTWSPSAARPGALRERLRGRVSVLVGHTGVGKSTLVNALVPARDRAIGHRQRRHRPRPAHLDLGADAARCPAAAGSSTPRASARSGSPTSTRAADRGVPGPRRADRRLPARLHPRRRRARVRARRGGRGRSGRRGPGRVVPPAARQPRASRAATSRRPRSHAPRPGCRRAGVAR